MKIEKTTLLTFENGLAEVVVATNKTALKKKQTTQRIELRVDAWFCLLFARIQGAHLAQLVQLGGRARAESRHRRVEPLRLALVDIALAAGDQNDVGD
jgi:hypothetical protein